MMMSLCCAGTHLVASLASVLVGQSSPMENAGNLVCLIFPVPPLYCGQRRLAMVSPIAAPFF